MALNPPPAAAPLRRLATLALAGLLLASPALAQGPLRGVALIVGHSDYTGLTALTNPENDARALDDLLGDLGFEVDRVLNADADELREELDEFAEDAAGADVALVYYSGHGIEAGGENYLVPIDTDVSSPEAAGEKLVPLSDLLAKLQATVPVTIVLLDACRTNSFPAGQLVQLPGADAPVAVSDAGLGETRGVPLARTNAATESLGVVIGFAAEPGHAALDGAPGGNSPYAAALLKHLGAGGYGLSDVMTLVTQEVYVETEARQLPWTNSSLLRFIAIGAPVETTDADEELIRDGRRALLMTIATAPADNRAFVEATATAEGVPLDALYGMLEALEVNPSTDPAALEQQLIKGAERLKQLMSERPADVGSDVELIRLADLAQRAEAEGAIDVALEFRERATARAGTLEETVDEDETRLRANRLQIAATYADHARTAEIGFDFAVAAQMWGRAFAQAERWDDALALKYLWQQAGALADQGEFSGENAPLIEALEAYAAAAELAPERSGDWASIENDRGNALLVLGTRATDPDALRDAVSAYEAVLELREPASTEWAGTQSNLGVALMNLGEREPGTATLVASADAFEASLAQMDRAAEPRSWAGTMSNLGNVLLMLGDREGNPDRYRAAADAHRASLEELTRESRPLDWSTAQTNLGQALARLGEMEEGNENLELAIAAFRAALEERDRARVPVLWSVTQDSLGSALSTLGQKTGDAALIEEGIAAFRASLEEASRDDAPMNWGRTQRNLAIALKTLGVGMDDIGLLEEAADAYRAAISVFDPELVPLDWAQTNGTLGIALMEIAAREPTEEVLREAREAFAAALEIYREADPGIAEYLAGRIDEIDGALQGSEAPARSGGGKRG